MIARLILATSLLATSAFAGQTCSIENSAQFPGHYYNIRLGKTLLNGNGAEFNTIDDAAKEVAKLSQSGICSTNMQTCAIVNSARFPGHYYNIQMGNYVLDGNGAEFNTIADTVAELQMLHSASLCGWSPVDCNIINSVQFPGHYYNITVNGSTMQGNGAEFNTIDDAVAAIQGLHNVGICR
jgi:hypothetical protein